MIFNVPDAAHFKTQALQWAAGFEVCCYMDGHQSGGSYAKFDVLIAAGIKAEVTAEAGDAFGALKEFRQQQTGWVTGFLGYDLKNELEQLSSKLPDGLDFPDLYFFCPQHLIIIKGNEVEIDAADSLQIWEQINQYQIAELKPATGINLQSRFSKPAYTDTFNQIKQHITRGDIYVVNFCQEFFAANAHIDPLSIFQQLNSLSAAPFTCFFKYHGLYILCASPERFMAKRGDKLISQPIKGTARRGTTSAEDEVIKQALRNSPKEQQENVMIVDLVRNDLTKSARAGSVQTEELFGIYTFEQVHQMISTVTCQLQPGLSAVDAIKNTFPMGSMTGAPKLKAMELIERYERTRRGVYSGAIGYFAPDDDFDFNVVIRSLLYNPSQHYLSLQVGSAITFDAIAEQEYEECLLKAKAIRQALGLTY